MLQLRTDKLTARIENGVGWVTFDRPERHNAASLDMWQALGDALDRLSARCAPKLSRTVTSPA